MSDDWDDSSSSSSSSDSSWSDSSSSSNDSWNDSSSDSDGASGYDDMSGDAAADSTAEVQPPQDEPEETMHADEATEPADAQLGTPEAEPFLPGNMLRAAAVMQAAADAQDGGVCRQGGGPRDEPTTDEVVWSDDSDEPPSGMPPQRPPEHKKRVWQGIGLGLVLHLLLLFVPPLYFGIGIVQLVYIVPALIICRKTPGLVQGLLIAAGVTFLLNAACFGYVMISLG
jgi:hypothetical protein